MASSKPATSGGRCPTCGAPALAAFRPFCSKRCADVDLHRWFSGAFAIPAVEADDPEEDDPDAARLPTRSRDDD